MQSARILGCVALAALPLALFGGASPHPGVTGPCRTEPAVLKPGGDLDVRMTVSHNAACAIWANAERVSVSDVTITTAPQHGTLAPRGRTGVTYRPARGFTGDDAFAFTLRGASPGGAMATTARVHASVQ